MSEKQIQYHVLHRRRIATMAGACNILEHNLRKAITDNREEENLDSQVKIPEYIDEKAMVLNVYKGALSRSSFCDEYQRMIDEAKLQRKIQRNASRVIETVISASHSFCENWRENEEEYNRMRQYLNDSVEWELREHGKVILSVAYHWDELSPHAHILSCPLLSVIDAKTNERRIKYSASEFFGSKGDLIKMHTDFHKAVGSKYGLERGVLGSRATHKELKDFRNWEKEQRAFLADSLHKVQQQDLSNQEHENRNRLTAQELAMRERELKKRELKINSDSQLLNAQKSAFERMVEKSKNDIPQVPEPPATLNRWRLKAWVESVQENITKVFHGLKGAYELLASKYSSAVSELRQLKAENKKLYDENREIKHSLLYMPIDEIVERRSYVASTQDRSNVEKDGNTRNINSNQL